MNFSDRNSPPKKNKKRSILLSICKDCDLPKHRLLPMSKLFHIFYSF